MKATEAKDNKKLTVVKDKMETIPGEEQKNPPFPFMVEPPPKKVIKRK
jgi:hypothetical protein